MIMHETRLDRVHPALAAIVRRAATYLASRDIIVVEGARTVLRQRELFALGRTAEELAAAGVAGVAPRPDEKKVTWTMRSMHIPNEDGFARAVDLAPYAAGEIQWDDIAAFDAIALSMFRAASALGTRLRWGADWDGDGRLRERGESDSPHFELVGGAP